MLEVRQLEDSVMAQKRRAESSLSPTRSVMPEKGYGQCFSAPGSGKRGERSSGLPVEGGEGETEEARVKTREEGCDSSTGWKVCGVEEKPAKLRL